jgi:hypothetical protein
MTRLSATRLAKAERLSQARRDELLARRTVTLDLSLAQLALLESLACDEGLSLAQMLTQCGLDIITNYRNSLEARS